MQNIVGNENEWTSIEFMPKAPSYDDLFNTVTELTERLEKLESVSVLQQPSSGHDATPAATSFVDYRILPDVGTSIWSFTGHESSSKAED